MSITDPDKLKLIKNYLIDSFNKANPEIWQKIQRKPEKIKQARKIQDRVNSIRGRVFEHCKKHAENWVSKETLKVMAERDRLILQHPMPDWAVNDLIQVSCLKEAGNRVQNRIQSRLNRVSEIGKRMHSDLLNNEKNHPRT